MLPFGSRDHLPAVVDHDVLIAGIFHADSKPWRRRPLRIRSSLDVAGELVPTVPAHGRSLRQLRCRANRRVWLKKTNARQSSNDNFFMVFIRISHDSPKVDHKGYKEYQMEAGSLGRNPDGWVLIVLKLLFRRLHRSDIHMRLPPC